MINILLGPPGGGKSYEAVVYHILPALAKGRKVITNLPLKLDYIDQIHPEYVELIEIRTQTRAVRPALDWKKAEDLYKRFGIATKQKYFNAAAFAHVDDYGDAWRHPETGSGPLYVIDECHIPLPKTGTEMEVEHWFSLHRHESADVLLLTQSYGKINQAIRDLVQVCYRVKKATAFGSNDRYIRKVQDGIRGEVQNTAIREYKNQYFPYYQSHTRGGGSELAANDIVPFWKRWPIIGSALCFLFVIGMLTFGNVKNPMKADIHSLKPDTETVNPPSASSRPLPENISKTEPRVPPASSSKTKNEETDRQDPLGAMDVHLVGHVRRLKDNKDIWMFSLSQNGQAVRIIYDRDLKEMGYALKTMNDCSAVLYYSGEQRNITCDAPTQQVRTPRA